MRGQWVALGLCLLLASPAHADFLQWGADARRTGAAQDGPAHYDVALDIDLGAARAPGAPPLIVGQDVFILTTGGTLPTSGAAAVDPGSVGVWRINGTTGARTMIHLLGDQTETHAFASDGERFYFGHGANVTAIDRSGTVVWTAPLHTSTGFTAVYAQCVAPTVNAGEVVFACFVDGTLLDIFGGIDQADIAVFGFVGATGEPTRTWFREITAKTGGGPSPTFGGYDLQTLGLHLTTADGIAYFMTAESGEVVGLNTCSDPVFGGDHQRADGWFQQVTAVDAEGALIWTRAAPIPLPLSSGSDFAGDVAGVAAGIGSLAIAQDHVIVGLDRLYGLDRATGCALWAREMVAPAEADNGVLALAGNDLVVGASDQMWRIDGDGLDEVWGPVEIPRVQAVTGMLTEGRRAIVATSEGILVMDVATGDALSLVTGFDGIPGNVLIGVANGWLAMVDTGGRFVLMGQSNATIRPAAALADEYPAFGDAVTLDVSGSRPGVQASDIEYLVDWGDGTVGAWSPDTRFVHTYTAPEGFDATNPTAVAALDPLIATVHARNSAGQEARILFPVYAGMPAPESDSGTGPLQWAADNQDATFFLIGGFFTMLGAAWAAWRLSRKRRRLNAELHALRQLEAEGAVDRLDELLDRAVDLLERDRIDERHYHILRDRIQAVERRLS